MKAFIALAALVLVVAGCHDSDNDMGVVNFTSFVKKQLASTSETTDPVDINRLTLVDYDRNDEQAYDDVLDPM